MPSLFDTYPLGAITLANRAVMAPMTRSRATNPAFAPTPDVAHYYAQRAGAGLIISEGVLVSAQARGWAFTPGIYTPEQMAAWRTVTDAVHSRGGVIFAQLWHTGRASHVKHQANGEAPVSSTATQGHDAISLTPDETGALTYLPQSRARALETREIPPIIDDFVRAAVNARAAGFDGVELHGANGYLFEQFMNGALNTRGDRWGGARIMDRLRFTLETVDAVASAIGRDRTAIRLSPYGRYNDMPPFQDEAATALTLADELSKRDLAYVHLTDEPTPAGERPIPRDFLDVYRATYSGSLILTGGYTRDTAQAELDAGRADLIGFGRLFIANPDLVARMRNDWPIAEWDKATFYVGGPKGLVDYPAYADSPAIQVGA